MSHSNNALLSEEALAEAMSGLPGWAVQGGMLTKTYPLKSYAEGVVFASAIGWTADGLDHHPDLFIGYQKVVVSTVTHDAGGLTGKDVVLARRVEALAR